MAVFSRAGDAPRDYTVGPRQGFFFVILDLLGCSTAPCREQRSFNPGAARVAPSAAGISSSETALKVRGSGLTKALASAALLPESPSSGKPAQQDEGVPKRVERSMFIAQCRFR